MQTFKITVTNNSEQQKLFKLFLLVVLPFLVLVIYHQYFPLLNLNKNLETIIELTFVGLLSLILTLQLRKQKSEEDVSFSKNEILTELVGTIKLIDISNYKSPSNSSWYQGMIRIRLSNGNDIIFSPIITQFGNKKNKAEFEKFNLIFESLITK